MPIDKRQLPIDDRPSFEQAQPDGIPGRDVVQGGALWPDATGDLHRVEGLQLLGEIREQLCVELQRQGVLGPAHACIQDAAGRLDGVRSAVDIERQGRDVKVGCAVRRQVPMFGHQFGKGIREEGSSIDECDLIIASGPPVE
jgi:hypothetical protein